VQGFGTEKTSQYFSKDSGDNVKAQTLQPQFTIHNDQMEHSCTTADHGRAYETRADADHEEMDLHPSVTAAFVPESLPGRKEIFDDINNTGGWVFHLLYYTMDVHDAKCQILIEIESLFFIFYAVVSCGRLMLPCQLLSVCLLIISYVNIQLVNVLKYLFL